MGVINLRNFTVAVVSPILKRDRNDNDISKFRYFSWRYRYDTIWPISTRYIVWTIYRSFGRYIVASLLWSDCCVLCRI